MRSVARFIGEPGKTETLVTLIGMLSLFWAITAQGVLADLDERGAASHYACR